MKVGKHFTINFQVHIIWCTTFIQAYIWTHVCQRLCESMFIDIHGMCIKKQIQGDFNIFSAAYKNF